MSHALPSTVRSLESIAQPSSPVEGFNVTVGELVGDEVAVSDGITVGDEVGVGVSVALAVGVIVGDRVGVPSLVAAKCT
jgi:hypothetical protein